MDGRVIGINSAIATESRLGGGTPHGSGVGFAVPIDMASNIGADQPDLGDGKVKASRASALDARCRK